MGVILLVWVIFLTDTLTEILDLFFNPFRKNTTNFTVIKDLNTLPAGQGPISSSGISEVTAVAITID